MLKLNSHRLAENAALSKMKGTYTLVVFVRADIQISVGRLGLRVFRKGYYAYTGSAFGKGALSLWGRINRHLRKVKKERWHIDYFLSDKNVEVTCVVACRTRRKMECDVNRALKEQFHAEIPVLGFGSSDCRKGCRSHLLFLGLNEDVTERIAHLYSEITDAYVYVLS
jgi:Uri superfamily endonuclease